MISLNEKNKKMIYKEVKIWVIVLVLILAVPFFNSCDDSEEDLIGNWVEVSDFDGVPRTDAVGFVIAGKGYIGTGYDGEDRLKDFWEYDADRNTWTQKADFPGIARNGAFGFGTDTKGYIGTGYDGKNKLKDFYEFDPSTNAWLQKADFGGSPRQGAVAMSINNKGYAGTGYEDNYYKDFWKYDPDTDTWTQIPSLGGSKRKGAASFVINGKGYVLTGVDNGEYQSDLWMYDPSTDAWTKKRSIVDNSDESYDDEYTSIRGSGKVGFAIGNKGYLATGGMEIGTETWEYDSDTDLWTEKTSFEGSTRTKAVGFAIGSRGYVTTGMSSASGYYDDLWAFDPDDEYNEDD